jgi:hypothetical protein
MQDIGIYKTTNSKTFNCHFDLDKQIAIALGPLPDLKITHKVEAQDKVQAIEKLRQEIGQGVFAGSL